MNTEMAYLQEVLEDSVKKNGTVPLTNTHLLNIIKMAQWRAEKDQRKIEEIELDPRFHGL